MKVISSKTVYQGRIFRLDKDIIQLGKNTITREIIHHPGSSLMLPVLDIKKKIIVMISQYRYAAGSDILEFPAGTKDKGESYRTCALRELTEETGYKADKISEVSRFFLAPGTMTEVMAMFACTKLVKKEQNLMPDEKIRTFTTSLDRAIKMIFSGRIKDAKTIAGVLTLKEIYADKRLQKKHLA